MENPYRSPASAVSTRDRANDELDDVVSGQKLVIYAILLYFVAALARVALGPLVAIAAIACMVMSWVGMYRLTRGLGYPMWWRIVLMVLMLVPLLGLLVLVVLSRKATARLRDAGYSVGLMGARDYR